MLVETMPREQPETTGLFIHMLYISMLLCFFRESRDISFPFFSVFTGKRTVYVKRAPFSIELSNIGQFWLELEFHPASSKSSLCREDIEYSGVAWHGLARD